jgi:2-oxoglutarate ferredoxin oxidoreductase subunit alpha
VNVKHPGERNSTDGFLPYKRDDHLVRPWAVPGTKGLEHRIGGLEKADVTGNVEYSPTNHQHMTNIRAAKVAGIAEFIPEQTVEGPDKGDLLVVSWGGTYGSVRTAVRQCLSEGLKVAHTHLRYMNPFPRNLGTLLKNYKGVLVPELNNGQLRFLLRNDFLVDAKGLNKVQGKPFLISEVAEAIRSHLKNG